MVEKLDAERIFPSLRGPKIFKEQTQLKVKKQMTGGASTPRSARGGLMGAGLTLMPGTNISHLAATRLKDTRQYTTV